MVTWFVLATVCTAVPFYARFLVAIVRECRHEKICYLVRIKPTENTMPVVEARRKPAVPVRAA